MEKAELTHAQVRKSRERHKLFAGTYIADFIYGANDGIVTVFAVIAAAFGATLSHGIIIVLGLANLIADGFSMGASNYLGIKSRKQFEAGQKALEEYEIEHWPEDEKGEIREMFAKKGFMGADLERAVVIVTSNKKHWVNEMLVGELGILPEEASQSQPIQHAVATFAAFVIIGFIPLIPFLFNFGAHELGISIAMTALTLFFVGGLRAWVTGSSFFKSGLQMLAIGGFASALAYVVGFLIKQITGIAI